MRIALRAYTYIAKLSYVKGILLPKGIQNLLGVALHRVDVGFPPANPIDFI